MFLFYYLDLGVPIPVDWPFYCPQNTTGFFDINFTIVYQKTDVNYCPQNTTGFFDFTQAP